MKRLVEMFNVFFLVILLCLHTFCYGKSGHDIVFGIENAKSQKAKIGYFLGSDIIYTDSSIFIGNTITFKGPDTLPHGLYLLNIDGKTVDFIVSEQHFSIFLKAFEDIKGNKVINSITNKLYLDYKEFVIQQKDKVNKIRKSQSRNPQDPLAKKQIAEIGNLVRLYRDSIFKKHPENLASKIIRAGIEVKPASLLKNSTDSSINKILREHLFDNIDLKDERLIHTPYLEENLLKSLKLTPFVPDSLAKTCEVILSKTTANKAVYRYSLSFFKNYFEKSNQPWMDVLYTYLAKKYYLTGQAYWADTNEILTIKANVARMDPILTGKIAPEMNFMDTLGRVVPMYSVKAKYTILYFWDAECSHCQEITPKLYSYYTKIKANDVEVYAVTIQQVWYSWKDYLKKYPMDWLNVFEPNKIEEIYKTYQIGSTPCIYLLDKDKRILCKKVTLEELKGYLNILLSYKDN